MDSVNINSLPDLPLPTFTGCEGQIDLKDLISAVALTVGLGSETFSKVISPDGRISVRRAPSIHPYGSFILHSERNKISDPEGHEIKANIIASGSFKEVSRCFLVTPEEGEIDTFKVVTKVFIKHHKLLNSKMVKGIPIMNTNLEGLVHPNISIPVGVAKLPSRLLKPNIEWYLKAEDRDGEAYLDDLAIGTLRTGCSELLPLIKIQVAKDCLLGLKYLHDCGFVHLDITPDNFLIFFVDGKYIGKIIDLDFVTNLMPTSFMQVWGFRAPETEPIYSFQSEIYSMGLTLLVFLTDKLKGNELFDFRIKLRSCSLEEALLEFSDLLPPELYTIIGRMLAQAPDSRPSLDEVIATFDFVISQLTDSDKK